MAKTKWSACSYKAHVYRYTHLGGEWVDSLLIQETVSLQLRLLSNHQVSTLIQFFLYNKIYDEIKANTSEFNKTNRKKDLKRRHNK